MATRSPTLVIITSSVAVSGSSRIAIEIENGRALYSSSPIAVPGTAACESSAGAYAFSIVAHCQSVVTISTGRGVSALPLVRAVITRRVNATTAAAAMPTTAGRCARGPSLRPPITVARAARRGSNGTSTRRKDRIISTNL